MAEINDTRFFDICAKKNWRLSAFTLQPVLTIDEGNLIHTILNHPPIDELNTTNDLTVGNMSILKYTKRSKLVLGILSNYNDFI